MVDLQYEWDEVALQRVRLVIQLKDMVDGIREAHEGLLEARIQHIEARSDIEGLKGRNASLMERLEREKSNVQAAADEASRAREEGRRLSEEVQDLMQDNADKQVLWTELANGKTPQELDMEMTAEEAKLELIHAANPNVMREFERRAQEIGRLKGKMEGLKEKLERLEGQLAEIMGRWEPRLDELVSKINDAFAYNFEQISCAGEVRVHKDDDFDLWALDIMVKFR